MTSISLAGQTIQYLDKLWTPILESLDSIPDNVTMIPIALHTAGLFETNGDKFQKE